MRNSHNITITDSDTFAADDETTVWHRGNSVDRGVHGGRDHLGTRQPSPVALRARDGGHQDAAEKRYHQSDGPHYACEGLGAFEHVGILSEVDLVPANEELIESVQDGAALLKAP